jgi:pSer/pThr/pTyr-binding forkhead associated (FHA) protein
MRDGSTRKIDLDSCPSQGFEHFLREWHASLVLISGDGAGSEYSLDCPTHLLGRGESADLRFADVSLSSEHAALEFVEDGFRLRDLGSMNGTLVNGAEVKACELKNGDEIRIGTLAFRYLLDERSRGPRTYQVPIVE